MAYKSYSYWFMIASLVLSVVFWVYKVFSTKFVIEMTKKLYVSKSKKSLIKQCSFLNGFYAKPGKLFKLFHLLINKFTKKKLIRQVTNKTFFESEL